MSREIVSMKEHLEAHSIGITSNDSTSRTKINMDILNRQLHADAETFNTIEYIVLIIIIVLYVVGSRMIRVEPAWMALKKADCDADASTAWLYIKTYIYEYNYIYFIGLGFEKY